MTHDPPHHLRARFLLAMNLPATAAAGLCAAAAVLTPACSRRDADLPVTMTPGLPDASLPVAAPFLAGPAPLEPVQPPGQCASQTCEAPVAPAPSPPMPVPFERCHRVHPVSGAQFSPARTTAMQRSAPGICCYVTMHPCRPSHPIRGRALRPRVEAQAAPVLAAVVTRLDWATATVRV